MSKLILRDIRVIVWSGVVIYYFVRLRVPLSYFFFFSNFPKQEFVTTRHMAASCIDLRSSTSDLLRTPLPL